MDIRIKSPDVARRLRGMGASSFRVDARSSILSEIREVENAAYFRPKGLDFEALCKEGRVFLHFDAMPRSEVRRIVQREIERQESLYDKANVAIAAHGEASSVPAMPVVPGKHRHAFARAKASK